MVLTQRHKKRILLLEVNTKPHNFKENKMSWQIISAIALIVLAIVAIIKKVETRMTLLLAGFAMCVLAGHPMAAFQSFIKGMNGQR